MYTLNAGSQPPASKHEAKSKFESREDVIDSRLLAKTAAVHKLVEEPP